MPEARPLMGAELHIALNAMTQPYWNATRQSQLVAPVCTECGRARMPFLVFCRHCRAQNVTWRRLAEPGRIYSFTFYPHPERAAEEDHVLAPALVVFEEAPGIRYAGNLACTDVARVAIGMQVRTGWIHNAEGYGFPTFHPIRSGAL